MTLITDLTLPTPKDNFGAAVEKRHLDHPVRFVISSLATLSLLTFTTLLLFSTPDFLSGFYWSNSSDRFAALFFLFVALCIAGLGVLPSSFSNPMDEYYEALEEGQREYGRTYFRAWLNERYNLDVSEKKAAKLFLGYGARLIHETDGKKEEVQAYLENVKWLRHDTSNFARANEDNDMPYLMFIELPAKPRHLVW